MECQYAGRLSTAPGAKLSDATGKARLIPEECDPAEPIERHPEEVNKNVRRICGCAKKISFVLPVLVGLILLLSPTVPAVAGSDIVVFAGSASQPPLEEAAAKFRKETGTRVALHFGGSGSMLNQARLTGQGDLYIPGSPDYMEKARELGVVEEERSIIAYLVPAIIVEKGNPQKIDGLKDLEREGLRVGLADPDGVCVGLYAVEILEASGMLDSIRPNLRGMVESCAKAAAMIPLNLVDAVLGWREFAAWNPQSMEAILLAPDEIPRLAYIPAAVLRHTQNRPEAERFVTFLESDEGQTIFREWGYVTEQSAALEFAPRARIGGSYTLPEGL